MAGMLAALRLYTRMLCFNPHPALGPGAKLLEFRGEVRLLGRTSSFPSKNFSENFLPSTILRFVGSPLFPRAPFPSMTEG